MEDPVCMLPVHELDAVVQVGHTGHTHGLGKPEHIRCQYLGILTSYFICGHSPVPRTQLHVQEVPQLGRVTRLSNATILKSNNTHKSQKAIYPDLVKSQ